MQYSPRSRGWSLRALRERAYLGVLPALAGVVPSSGTAARPAAGAPRARGGGPDLPQLTIPLGGCSPRSRGWSHADDDAGLEGGVLPALAGVVPGRARRARTSAGAPRARGGGPMRFTEETSASACSPRSRGWSLPAGRRPHRPRVLPALAGVVPSAGRRGPGRRRAPRARGGGPGPSRHAGTSAVRCAPRARGGGPPLTMRETGTPPCSPRSRGWSHHPVRRLRPGVVLPALAGVVPAGSTRSRCRRRAPRARGGGPSGHMAATLGGGQSLSRSGIRRRRRVRPSADRATRLNRCGRGSVGSPRAVRPTVGNDRTARTSAARRRGRAPWPVRPVSAR